MTAAPSTIAHYRLTTKLGEGGMGAVYRATDTKLNRDVAIKILPDAFAADPDRLARFIREAQVLASLNHPRIAAIYGVEERALVLELVEGPTLADRIAQGPIRLDEALPLARQIAEALEYAHEKGIVHRDLKPANIKLTAEGEVKVLDFGLAKAISTDSVAPDPANSPTLTMRSTMAGVIMGTAAYMSPEQARGLLVDRRADIWSFGVVLFEMLTGKPVFSGPTISDILAAVLKSEPDWNLLPAAIPTPLRRLLRRCLARDRKQRLSDIGDARLEIDEALSAPSELPAIASAPSPAKSSRLPWLAAGLLALLGGAISLIHFRETATPRFPVRFQIDPAGKYDYGSNGGMAFSPDGRSLAFVGRDPSQRELLWLRPLDGLEAHSLPGSEGARLLPCWSPDSKWIAFSTGDQLRKIPVAGGPVEKLASSPENILGCAWSPEGTILYGTNARGLWRVSAAGGTPVLQTVADEKAGEIGHLRPFFLPDGRHFLYVTRMTNPNNDAIYLASLDSKQRQPLVPSQQFGQYSSPAPGSPVGHLLFLRDGNLMALPLDPKSYERRGEPFLLAEKVGSALALGFFAAGPNGALAYRSGNSGGWGSSQLTWMDPTGKVLSTLGPVAGYSTPVLSPDAHTLAVSRIGENSLSDIWLFDVARNVPTRFTFGGNNQDPVWTPDGKQIVFTSSPTSGSLGGIYQKAADGAAQERLMFRRDTAVRPTGFSPDGKYLIAELPNTGLIVISWPPSSPDAQSTPYFETNAAVRQGQFSLDGKWVAYASNEGNSGRYDVYVQSFPAGNGKYQISTAGGMQPRWRRDGRELYFVGPDGVLWAVDIHPGAHLDIGLPRRLFSSGIWTAAVTGTEYRYDVAPDGNRFLINPFGQISNVVPPITVVLNWNAR